MVDVPQIEYEDQVVEVPQDQARAGCLDLTLC